MSFIEKVIQAEVFIDDEHGYCIYILPSMHKNVFLEIYEDYTYGEPVADYVSIDRVISLRKSAT